MKNYNFTLFFIFRPISVFSAKFCIFIFKKIQLIIFFLQMNIFSKVFPLFMWKAYQLHRISSWEYEKRNFYLIFYIIHDFNIFARNWWVCMILKKSTLSFSFLELVILCKIFFSDMVKTHELASRFRSEIWKTIFLLWPSIFRQNPTISARMINFSWFFKKIGGMNPFL